ncbi:hypothetical protein [Acrocarpospora macrocephala]|uniref:hypothetical protein n=1 Tax=Acrocarpospora macrocephala TaxID=150177 RepID=UPI0012D3699A|nr:hypothetical protein [Acrocarpospora macrocephala]
MTAAFALLVLSVLLGASRATSCASAVDQLLAAVRARGLVWMLLVVLGLTGLFLVLLLACAARTAAALAVHVLIGACIALAAIGAHVVALTDSPRAIGA